VTVEGGCSCGAIRYRIEGAPSSISICHCRSCRRASGAPAVSWFIVSRSQFRLAIGVPTMRQSSRPVRRSFCGTCGTQLTYEHESAPDTIELTTGSLDEPARFAPTKEIWLAEKLPWAAVNANLEHHSQEEDMVAPSNFQPGGWHTVTPRIIVHGAEKLVDFVKNVFGATGQYHSHAPAELRLGDSIIMISDAGDVRDPMTACLYVYVENADLTWQRAIEAGAQSTEPPTNTPYGDRRGMIKDPWGNTWQIATRRAELS
jgi:PhnB protein